MKILKHLSLAIIVMLLQSPAKAGLSQLIRPANPIPSHPSTPIDWLSGFTERDLLIIAAAADLNHGMFADVSYDETTTAEDCRATFGKFKKSADDTSEDVLFSEYQDLKKNNKRGTFALKKTLLLQKIDKVLAFMLAQDDKFSGFSVLHKHFIIKHNMLQLIRKIESMTQARKLLKRKKNILASKEYAQLLQKIGHQLLSYENILLQFNILNDNAIFEKRKEIFAAAAFPLSKATEFLAEAYTKTAPHMPEKPHVISKLFMEDLDRKHDALMNKIKVLSKRVSNQTPLLEWQESTSKDVSIFTDDNSLQKQPMKPTSRKKPATSLSLNPFGTMPSAPSPIPVLSWRRLAEIFSTKRQKFHASDFSTVMDWPSFFSFMQNDIPARTYNNSLFAKFLRIYAPASYHDLFPTDLDFLSPQDFRKRYFTLINSIIERLQNTHKAYAKYTARTTVTQLEAQLLLKLLTLYKQGEKELAEFPRSLYKIYNETLPLKQRFAPHNVGIRLNTHNTELYKLIQLFQKSNYLETASGATNKHSAWSGSAAALKAPAWAGTLLITSPARAIQTTLPTKERRVTQTARAQAKKRITLLEKIKDGIVRIQRTPINETYSKHIVHATPAPTTRAAKKPTPADYAASAPKTTRERIITDEHSKELLPPHSTAHELEKSMIRS